MRRLLWLAPFFVLGCADALTEAAPDARVPDPTGCRDLDRDGYGEGAGCRGTDCNDDDPRINPGQLEICDGLDNDCNGTLDDGLVGRDCDQTRGVCAGARQICERGDWAECGGAASYGVDFEADETRCDNKDNDCDGFVDESCPCEPGATQPCGEAEGACEAGVQRCAEGAWGPCEGEIGPAEEICDGQDQDCDGLTDEGLDAARPECALSAGVCAGAQRTCQGVGGWHVCDATEYGDRWVAEEGAAHCDALDNDCDGRTDEGCGCLDGAEQPCGIDVGACQLGTQTCVAGAWSECRGGVTPRDEACGGGDEDCDGTVDEGLAAPACARNQGVCAGALQVCGPDGWAVCTQATYAAHDATYVPDETPDDCDRLDNDCDGNVDEACQCAAGDTQNCGVNEGACTQGQQACQGGRWGACSGVAPVAETCNGVDDDCDGRADEGIAGAACPLDRGVCAGATQQCVDGALAACGAEAYGPSWQADEDRCDGLDNDCDGVVDEGCACGPDDIQRCGTDTGACTRGSQRCVEGQWGPCEDAVEPAPEQCNGVDDDCDESTDEALSPPACPLQQGVCTGATRTCLGEVGFAEACGAAEYGEAWVPDETDAHCDGRDNDCDGQIDEGCECVPGGERPVCGTAVGACETGLLRCEAGQFTACEGEVAATPETCNGADDDCDATTDENVEAMPCPLQVGVCADTQQVCSGEAGFSPCGVGVGYPATYRADEGAEDCDGLDNDCDGATDERCPAPLVRINEVFYDAPGADGPNAFIELVGEPGAPLAGMALEGVNGSNGEVYVRIPLSGQMPSTGYYLIVEEGTNASPGASGTLRDIANLVARGADLQNGPDSLRLMFNGQPLDAVAYGEFGEDAANAAGEGAPAPGATEASLTRSPDGRDTDDNATDFVVAAVPTPRGAPLPRVHLALRWAGAETDFDLHYLREGTWASADDCHWGNRLPEWGARLERDDTDGLGPEFLDHGSPAPGRYLVQVQYYSVEDGPDTATVGIFIDGVEVLLEQREMSVMTAYWAVAQIDVAADGTIEVASIGLADGAPFDN